MPKRKTGRYERIKVAGEEVAAFVPSPLPPSDPPLVLDPARTERVRIAEQALVRLDLAGEMVPSLDWFLYAFLRKEAVVSSQIEGTQATLIDLLEFEAQGEGEPNADVEEVLQLPRGAEVRASRACRSEGAAALDAPAQRDASTPPERRARIGEAPWRGPPQPELDRRHPPGERRVRTSPAPRPRQDPRGL